MPKNKEVNFALLGLGKLGSGFYKIWLDKKEKIKQETGFDLNLKMVLVKNVHFKRPSYIDRSLITTDINDIIDDGNIHIAIDTIGGIEPTWSIIKQLVNNKIHIISANRTLLASKMHELADLANENKVFIQPEPSLGGGIPVLKTLEGDLVANKISNLYGIISGTSNFILSEMTQREVALEEVLKQKEIQDLGESISIIDYEGSDAAQKMSVLAASSFGVDINFLHIHAEGISDITAFDIQCAREFGYEFKMLAIIKDHSTSIELRVHPTLVPIGHPLTMVRGEYNAYFIQTDLLGNYMVYGKGVGIEATSSIILRDIVAVGTKIRYSSSRRDAYRLNWNDKKVMNIEDIQSSYYVRFPCQDKPGVIGQITSILGNYNINISSAHAEVNKRISTELGFVHILIDDSMEKDIYNALHDIKKLDIIRDRIKYFRIL